MSAAQPGILTPIPVVGRYLFFSISQPEQVAATLASLAAATDGYQLVVGIGHSLMLSLGKTVEGMKDYPVLAAPGIDLPSTPSALWCWLRGEDRGEVTLRSHALERSLAPAFQRTGAVDAFLYGEDRDLSGYKDGTENPKGDAALEAALVSGRGAGLDGGSFVAVQQWLHDFDRMQAIPGEEMDNIIGRRKSDDEELEDAPAYAHVKRTEQESFEPAAFLLRRGAPWSDEHRAGLLFAAFGRSFEAFEVQWLRMIGVEDGVLDGLFRFTRPISGSYFWCPPMADGRLDPFVRSEILAEAFVEPVRLHPEIAIAVRRQVRCGQGQVLLGDATGTFAAVGGEGGDIDQPDHIRLVAGLGDHRAAIGVSDQQDRPLLLRDHLARPLGIVRQRGQR